MYHTLLLVYLGLVSACSQQRAIKCQVCMLCVCSTVGLIWDFQTQPFRLIKVRVPVVVVGGCSAYPLVVFAGADDNRSCTNSTTSHIATNCNHDPLN